MSELERVLAQALRDAGDSYRPGDVAGAQRVFLARRRGRRMWRAVATLAFAATAVAAALVVPAVVSGDEEGLPPAGVVELTATDTIPVGAEPTGIDVGAGAIWVAHSGDGSLLRLDPRTGEAAGVPLVAGGEVSLDDVSVDAAGQSAWAVDGGRVYLYGMTTERDRLLGDASLPGGHLDIDAGEAGLWVAHAPADGRSVTLVQPGDDLVLDSKGWAGGPFSDLAEDRGRVWLLNGESGELYVFDPATPRELRGPIAVGPSYDDDLTVGAGYVWVANGDRGTVVRVDPATGEVSPPVSVGGDYTALAVGDGYVWALAGSRDGTGTVTAIDPDSVEPAGKPLTVDGDPVDIAAGEGAVWVTNSATDAVTRIEVVGAAPG